MKPRTWSKPCLASQRGTRAPTSSDARTAAAQVFLAVALISGIAHAQAENVYKWKDGNNVTTFSRFAPGDGVAAEVLHVDGSSSRPVSPFSFDWRASRSSAPDAWSSRRTASVRADARPAETPAQQERRARLDAQEASQEAYFAIHASSECTQANNRFNQLTRHTHVQVETVAGGVRVLAENERIAFIEAAKTRIIELCG